jgi:hypothetical protein
MHKPLPPLHLSKDFSPPLLILALLSMISILLILLPSSPQRMQLPTK